MSAAARAASPRPFTIFAGAAVSLLLALGGAASASAASGPSLYAGGLHIPAGGIVAPDSSVWVSDHNGGFCRVSAPSDRGPGTLDHPSTPGEPAGVARTCLGGLLPDAAPGPDGAGQAAFYDPTPEFAGSGDEIVLIPDGASPSMDVWRAHWNPNTETFEADPDSDVIAMDADPGEDRPRPTAVSVAPDGDAYVVFQRSNSIQRIVEPDSATPRAELVGFTSDGVGSTAVAAAYGPFGPMGPPTIYVGEGVGIRQIAGRRGSVETTTDPSPFSAGTVAGAPATVSTLAYQATDTVAGQGTLYAGTADAAAPLALPGPDSLLRLNADADPTVVATGFSTVGGLAIRPDDGSVFVFDDPAVLIDGEPLGRGRAFVIGDPFTEILSGPSQKEGQPALDPDYTADPTPAFTYSGEFTRECSLTAADAAANDWRPCGDDTTYTASGPAGADLSDGRYRFAVRSVDGTRIGAAATRLFTVDTTAPTATPVILNPEHDSRHLRAPRLSFDSDDPGEPEFAYRCRIDDLGSADDVPAYEICDEGIARVPGTRTADSPGTPLPDGAYSVQARLVDAAGNVGSVESDSTPTVADDPATADVDESAGTVGAQPTAFTVGVDPIAGPGTEPAAYGELARPDSAAVYADSLHLSTGVMEDPAGRVWVADHNAGFCRVSDPTVEGAGRIEHPEVPGRPRSEPRTCLGGLLPDAGPGADSPGPPTFVDPTPRKRGNGDEVAIVADGFAASNHLVRYRWDPGTELFQYLDRIFVPAVDRAAQDRARPVATQLGPDPDGIDGPKQPSLFFVNKRDTYVGRVDAPAGDSPSAHVAGFVGPGGRRAEVLAVGQREEGGEKRPVVYLVSQNGLERLDNPRVEGEEDAPATLQAAALTIPGVADAASSPSAMAYDLQRDLLYIGTANGALPGDAGIDRFVRWDPHGGADGQGAVVSDTAGFSMVGGIGLRNDGRILVVDDEALLDPAEPLGRGLMYQIGNPAARIAGGPSDPEGDATDASYTSGTTPSFALAGDTPRQCWLRAVGATEAPAWQPCDGETFTTPTLSDGDYKLTVRAGADPVPADIDDATRYVPHTRRFTVDTAAPARPRVTDVRPLAADGVTSAEPSFAFEGEAGARYSCRLNGDAYNKVPCRPGRSFPREGTPRVQDGANSLYIKVTDRAGNTSEESPEFRFTADATVPVVTISSPSEGQATGAETRFVFKASETTDTRYGCRLDGNTFKRCDRPSDAGGPGQPYAIENLADGSVAVTYRDLSAGEHRFQVHASDNHANVSPNASRNVRVDTTAPTAVIDAPAPNETTGSSTTLRSHVDPATVGPGETNTLACTLDGAAIADADCDESIPVSGLSHGEHTFTVQATDSAGNAGPVASRTWNVDATAPVITITEGGVPGVAPTFTVTTDEPATLLCAYDAPPSRDCATLDGSGLGPGSHVLNAQATDPYGNVSTASRQFTLVAGGAPGTVVAPVLGQRQATAARLVPVAISRPTIATLGLPVTFAAEPGTTAALIEVFRVGPGTAATAARAAALSAGAAGAAGPGARAKPIIRVTRRTIRPGVNRMRLKGRTITRLLRPGTYRVDLALRKGKGRYGRPQSATVRVRSAEKVLGAATRRRAAKR